jgi:RHS repeat-associated protein
MKRLLVFCAVLIASPALAQDPATGFPPFGSFAAGGFDAVNRQNLNVNFAIPVVSVPGRGLNISHAITYDSLIWKRSGNTWVPVTDANGAATWGWNLNRILGTVKWSQATDNCYMGGEPAGYISTYNNYSYTDPAGTKHDFPSVELAWDDCLGAWSGSSQGTATDASGFSIVLTEGFPPTFAVYSRAGIKVTANVTDTNGNFISSSTVGNITTWVDTLGRNALKVTKLTGAGNCGTGYAECIEYEYKDSGGTSRVIKVYLKSYNVKTNFTCSGVVEYNQSGKNLPDKIEFPGTPSTLTYTFVYEESFSGFTSGRLKRVNLPTGGYYEYLYPTTGNKGINCTDGTIVYLTRYISAGESTTPWILSRSFGGGNWATTVFESSYSWSGTLKYIFNSNGRMVTEQVLNTFGSVIRTTTSAWATNGTPSSITTVLEDASGTNKPTSKVETDFDSNGNLLERREFALGTGTFGSLVRKTTNTYTTIGNIRDRVTQVIIRDGGGAIKSRKDIAYDGTSSFTGANCINGVPHHDDTAYGCSFLGRGNPISITRYTDAASAAGPLTTTFSYDSLGNLRSRMDPGNHTTTLAYGDSWADGTCPPSGNTSAYLTQATNHISQTSQFSYYACTGLVKAQKDPNDIANSRAGTTFTYDQLGRTTQTSSSDGGLTTFTYNDANRTITTTTKRTDTENVSVTKQFNGLGLVTQQQLPGGRKIDITYDPYGRPSKVTNPYIVDTEPTYGYVLTHRDPLGRVTAVWKQDNTVAQFQYAGNVATFTDETGKQRRTYSDALGRLIQVDEPGQGFTGGTPGTGSVNITGSEQSVVDGEWVEQCALWFEGYCLEWEWVWQEQTYWDFGGVSITVNGLTKSTTYAQGSTGSSIATALRSAINADSNYPVTAGGTGSTVTLTAKTNGFSTNYSLSATSWTSDPAHFSGPSFVPVPSGSTLTGGTDGTPGGPFSLTTPAVTLYVYDMLGNMVQVTQGQQTRTMAYDSLGRITAARIPEVNSSTDVTYTYDSDSNLTSVTNPRGTVNYEYDALHRIKKKKHGTTLVGEYTYDGTGTNNAIGRLITDTDGPVGTADKTDYTHDPLGRVLTANRTVASVPYTVAFEYDRMGNGTKLTYPSGRVVEYAFNTAAELNKVTDATNPSAKYDYVSSTVYSALRPVEQVNFGNSVRTTLGWNKRGKATSIVTEKQPQPPGPAYLNLAYSYYNNGQIQQITNGLNDLKSEKYTYDELGRLLTAQRGPDNNIQRKYVYEYDRYANRTKQDWVAGGYGLDREMGFNQANNRTTEANYNYDTTGNLTAIGLSTSYAYDLENFVTTAMSATYKVDTQGRRVRKTVGSTVTEYFYSGSMVISEKQGTTWTDYIFFGDTRIAKQSGASPVGTTTSAATAKYSHADHLGSTLLFTDANGNSLGTCDYEPFGQVQPGSTCSVPTNYRFAAMEWDADAGPNGLYRTWYRYYDADQGRWMAVDPLPGHAGDPQTLDRYAYVANDPINRTDPNGLDMENVPIENPLNSFLPWWVFGGGGGGGSGWGDFSGPVFGLVPSGVGVGNLGCIWNELPWCLPRPDWTTVIFGFPDLDDVVIQDWHYKGNDVIGDYRGEQLCDTNGNCQYWNPDTRRWQDDFVQSDIGQVLFALNELTTPFQNAAISGTFGIASAGLFVAGTGAILGGCSTGPFGCAAGIYGGLHAYAGGIFLGYAGYQFTVNETIPSFLRFFRRR